MKRRLVLTGSAVLAAGAVTAAAFGFGGPGDSPSEGSAAALTTAPVTKANLTKTQTVSGVLGYGPPVTVTARGPGTVTWLPSLGATVSRGQPLYEVNDRPVTLFYGGLPLYRPLGIGDSGDDVRQIETNLAALGYAGITVDGTFTNATAAAVRKWQKDLGVPQTGLVDPGTVAIAPGPVRIAQHVTQLGADSGGPVLAYAGTTRVVSIALDVALQDLAKAGLTAQVILPNGKAVDGVIGQVGTVATPGQDEQHPATIQVTVTLADQSTLGALDQAPVVVKLASSTVENVLTVPITALVALAEGGYGVQVVTGSQTRYVAVQPGMFASGRVQITGDGIAEGTQVVVPS
ncbi:peptidoglycan-binding protein [Rhizocola hellebori]|uniref:Peptidoglycan-binding protein n=1 Tax=Rhizocola hellebori TaxID=1392758 RepID=A0A8J3VEH9_9ACTN|nr:peptidoglycan-binding protein [Rhizocola hellebori]GIH03565.1 peptidoglycan-binding protein [Rhizocola hellebori]